jgi:hypothetical protein
MKRIPPVEFLRGVYGRGDVLLAVLATVAFVIWLALQLG